MTTTVEVAPPFDQKTLRRAFSVHPSGVTAVCAQVDGQPVGMVVSTFTSVSLDPALVSVCVAKTSSTWPALRRSRGVGLSILASTHQEVSKSLSSKDADRFSSVTWTAHRSGAVLIQDACLWLDCEVIDEVSAGDHSIVVLQITTLEQFEDREPLVFHGSGYRAFEKKQRWLNNTRFFDDPQIVFGQ